MPNPAPMDHDALIEMHLIKQELAELRPKLDLLSGFLDEQVDNPSYGLAPGATKYIDRQFLVFDPGGDGLAAELHGTIGKHTRDVGILVPGTGTDLLGFEGDSERGMGFAMTQTDGSLAVITWLGYDAPDSLPLASNNQYADAGAPALRDFVAGLGLDPGIDVTVVGHSYGGAVVGAAEREGLRADNIVHVAGAGASVDDISDYPHDARRYSMTAPGDFISGVQGKADADPGARFDQIGHGIDPDDIPGVTRLETGRVDADDPHSDMLEGRGSHSTVFTRGSHAWDNIYNVMVGGEVTLHQPGDGWGPFADFPMQDPEYVPPRADIP